MTLRYMHRIRELRTAKHRMAMSLEVPWFAGCVGIGEGTIDATRRGVRQFVSPLRVIQ